MVIDPLVFKLMIINLLKVPLVNNIFLKIKNLNLKLNKFFLSLKKKYKKNNYIALAILKN